MLRKLPLVALMALGMGLGVAARSAQAASYAGGASLRICPVPQECCGHVQYQLQRQTCLKNVQETVYETQQVPCVRTVCETVMQPRTITTTRTWSSTTFAMKFTRCADRSTGRSAKRFTTPCSGP